MSVTIISTPIKDLDRAKAIFTWIDDHRFEIYNREKGVLFDGAFDLIVRQAEKQTTDIIALAGGCYGRCLE